MPKIVLLLALIFSLSSAKYELGDGMQVASLPLYVGGYLSLDYQYREEYARYRVDDVAFLAYGSYSKFSYLLELEYKELYVHSEDNEQKEISRNTTLYTERVYLDYHLDENYLFRVGKYNSPIGFWNLLPINVLRETTSSPKSSYLLFPKFTTGLNASYSSYEDKEFKLDLILQHNSDIDAEYNNYEIDQHYALGMTYHMDYFTYKINLGFFHPVEDMQGDDLYYLLASAKYEDEKYQVMTEVGTQKSENEFTTRYAGYLQALYRFTPKHIGVVRLESYKSELLDTSDSIGIFGYTYRPLYPVAMKLEYQLHKQSEENQFLCSFSVLF